MLLLESPLIEIDKSIAFYTKLGFEISQEKDGYLAKENRFAILLNSSPSSKAAIHLYDAEKTKSFHGPSGILIHLIENECPYALKKKTIYFRKLLRCVPRNRFSRRFF